MAAMGIVYRVRYSVEHKLTKANASSVKTAVTPDNADLTLLEREWLTYLTGGMTSQIRKTSDNRYYLRAK